MFPNLSYLSNYLFGTPADNFLSIFQTFGMFLVLAFLASAFIFRKELIRKRKQGLFTPWKKEIITGQKVTIVEILSNTVFGFIIGLKVPLIFSKSVEFSQDPTGLLLSMEGNWIIGILSAIFFGGLTYYLGSKNAKDEPEVEIIDQYPEHIVMNITLLAALYGILGSKLFSVFENWESFIQAPIRTFFSGSGLTIYGGLIMAFIGIYIYIKRKGIAPIHIMDAAAPAMIIGYVVGRMGCQFAGDGDWGIVNLMAKPDWFIFPEWAWAFDYPHNVVNDLRESVKMENCGGVVAVGGAEPIYCTKLKDPVFPTPLYEIVAGSLIFAILWILRTRIKIAGIIFFLYVFLNGVERFFIEKIRVNPKYDLLGLDWSLSQWIAFGLIITGLTGIVTLLIRNNKKEIKSN